MVDHLASMLAAEAIAAADGLQLVPSGRHHKVILKSDSPSRCNSGKSKTLSVLKSRHS
jgi:hypothetical protein